MRIASYGCTWEVWRALRKARVALGCASSNSYALSCSPNFLRASITRYTHAKREQILNFHMASPKFKKKKTELSILLNFYFHEILGLNTFILQIFYSKGFSFGDRGRLEFPSFCVTRHLAGGPESSHMG